ncbi:polymer-forming cytoskeletal protein [Paraburkholderia sp. SIMBA_054]|uniref:polymer-forming cytoskeletal protein n=1 Tax=Paraburkholderia sp. SIMBA_054 TaxID=3085795 RepID=UPI00397B1F87
MNTPLASVTSFNRREDDDQIERTAEEAAPFDRESAHRTSARLLPNIFKTMMERFKQTDGGQLYIDHELENVRSALVGIPQFEGTMVFAHGVHIRESLNASKGVIKAPGQTVIIAEGTHVTARIECKKLYNLGTFEGAAKVTDLLLNYGSIDGEIQFGALESAGPIRGNIMPLTA